MPSASCLGPDDVVARNDASHAVLLTDDREAFKVVSPHQVNRLIQGCIQVDRYYWSAVCEAVSI